MPITVQQLLKILPNAGQVAGVFVPVLNTAMNRYQIVSQKRIAAFIAQVGHESGQLTRLMENLNYSADGLANTWPNRYAEPDGKGGYLKVLVKDRQRNKPNALGLSLAGKPEQIANNVYAGRMGSTAPGDGWKYRGRGLIQLTGKTNYLLCGEALGLDLLTQPDLLEKPQHACMAAAWFWSSNGLNSLADKGDIETITRRVNGGLTGLADRQAIYDRALKVLA
ncbi:glycoside hydrolase family 19 protein [Pseudomonas helleri]|uniref:Glycoside hydrolase family 19 protein n=1 Tax=Pseudomonas helleri TaxID=1608996 RepID=A0A7X1Y596_9PSED|nr:glycoside hydrolase family 19 protein [Pseudomonas helleri]MQT93966.1 glycoside hydrolase family 19 protein [Pseudomonas helleri]MQU30611.1 glycoside hydrolase family 19 protein [Pseudomonas helleri]